MGIVLLLSLRRNMANEQARQNLPFLITALPFVISLFLAQSIRIEEEHKIQAYVEARLTRLQVTLQATLENQVKAMVRMAAQMQRRKEINLDEWSFDSHLLLEHFPNFSSLVLTDENFRVRAFETLRIGKQGLPRGTDIAFTPERRTAMEKTRDTGIVTASGPFQLLVAKTNGFLVPVRVLHQDTFYGLLIGYFRTGELVESIVSDSAFQEFGMKVIYEGQTVYENPKARVLHRSDLVSMQSMLLYGRPWQLEMWISPKAYAGAMSPLPGITVVAGASTSGLLFILLLMRRRANQKQKLAEDAMQRLSSQSRETHEALKSVQDRQYLIDQIGATAPHLIFVYDINLRKLLYASRAVDVVLGLSHESILHREYDPSVFAIHPDDKQAFDDAFLKLKHGLASNAFVDSEYRILNSAGQWQWVANRLTVFLRSRGGEVVQILSASFDITTRKSFEFELEAREEATRILCEISSNTSFDFWARLEKLFELGCDLFGLETGGVLRAESATFSPYYIYSRRSEKLYSTTIPFEETFCSESFFSNEPLAISSVLKSNWEGHLASKKYGIQAYLGIALSVDKQDFGTLFFCSTNPLPHPFRKRDTDFMKLMAELIGHLISRHEFELSSVGKRDLAFSVESQKYEHVARVAQEVQISLNRVRSFSESLHCDTQAAEQKQMFESLKSSSEELSQALQKILNLADKGSTEFSQTPNADLGALEVAKSEFKNPVKKRLPSRTERLRILLAEDNLVNQQVALLLLDKLGYQAQVVQNGKEAFELLQKSDFDVVFMDIQMPEMDGYEATRKIRSSHAVHNQPFIIAMTANALQGDKEKCLAAGMDAYISKPVRLEDFIQTLGDAFGKSEEKAIQQLSLKTDSFSFLERIPATRLDKKALFMLAKFGGKKVLIEVFEIFIEGSKERSSNIERAILEKEFSTLEREFHSIKSTAKYFGAAELAVHSERLEKQAKDHLVAELNEFYSEFLNELQLVIHDIQAILKVFKG